VFSVPPGLINKPQGGNTMQPSRFLIGAFVALLAAPAFAQAPPPNPANTARIRGVIDQHNGSTLVVKAQDGTTTTVTLAPDVRIVANAKRSLSDIKAGDFVGSAAVTGADGKLHAQEVHIFTEAMRGTGEGQRPMAAPNTSMTNATVAEVAVSPKGNVLTLKYKMGQAEIEVSPDTPIIGLVPGDMSLLKPGATVSIMAAKGDDGTLTARSVTAEKDGVKPLM
jgi:hypothetical protein